MNLNHLRRFVVVTDCGTVSAAAAKLRITQPALSRQINALQEELGLKLFEPSGRRLVITSEGEEFLRHCRALLSQADAVLASAQSISRGMTGVIRIGAAPQTIVNFFPSFLQRQEKLNKDVRIRLFEASGKQQLEMLERGEIHFAITILVGDEDQFTTFPLPQVPLLVLAHKTHRLGSRGVVDIRMLSGKPLLLIAPGFAARTMFDAACRLARLKPNVLFEGGAPYTLAALAEAGHGIAVIPATLKVKSKHLRVSRLEFNGEPIALSLAIIWDDRRPLPHYARDFPARFSAHIQRMRLA